MLIENGADENAKTKSEETPIVLARREGYEIQRNISCSRLLHFIYTIAGHTDVEQLLNKKIIEPLGDGNSVMIRQPNDK